MSEMDKPMATDGADSGERRLRVYSNTRLVGHLQEHNSLWEFAYAPAWVQAEDSWDLSPHITRAAGRIRDGGTLRPVQWFFDNLLPEDRMRSAIAAKAAVPEADAFALLQYLGAESAGALLLLPEDAAMPQAQGTQSLPEAQLNQRIRNMARVPIATTGPKRMSLAGAQHKLLVQWDGAHLSEPLGATPSTHILKPEHLSPDYPHSVMNEYTMMQLAARLGLDAPRVWRHYCPQPVYIVERFDRAVFLDLQSTSHTERLHIIDSCQLLNKAHTFKYAHATLDTLRAVVESTRNRLATRLALFRWLLFNVLMGNHDNHLKNLSFMVDAQGLRMAPTYDLLSTAVYHTEAFPSEGAKWPQIDLAIPLPRQPRFADVTRQGLVDAGAALGLSADMAQREIGAMAARIGPELDALITTIAQENQSLPDNTRNFQDGELRLLRAIRHVIVADMLQRVA